MDRFSIIFGISDYVHLPQLPEAQKDVDVISDALLDAGFEVRPNRVFRQKLFNDSDFCDNFESALQTLPDDAVAFIYFSGHGGYILLDYVFCCAGMPGPKSGRVSGKAVSKSRLRYLIEAARDQLSFVIVLIDACNRAVSEEDIIHLGIDVETGSLNASRLPTNICFVHAARPGYVALSPAGGPSYFTDGFAKAIRKSGTATNLGQAVSQAARYVDANSPEKQIHFLDPPFDTELLDVDIFAAPHLDNGSIKTAAAPGDEVRRSKKVKIKVASPKDVASMTDQEIQAYMRNIEAEYRRRFGADNRKEVNGEG